MRTSVQDIDMYPQLAKRHEIARHNIAKLLLKGMLQSRPVGTLIVILVDEKL